MVAGCIRTVTEEPCMDCKSVTNAYDALMGRLCPKCIARRGTQFGYALEHRHDWFKKDSSGIERWRHQVTDEEVKTDPINTDLLQMPLIDHSDDIDKNVKETL